MLHKYNGLGKRRGLGGGTIHHSTALFWEQYSTYALKGVSGMKKNNFFFEQKTP
jgi:hypothetical protein